MITDAILKVKRLATPMKFVGIAFLVIHCITVDIRFSPVWVLVYVAIAFAIVNICLGAEHIAHRIRSPKKSDGTNTSFTAEEMRCIDRMSAEGYALRAKPWKFLLIAGEDGFFFLPLLYIGVTLPAVILTSAFFAAMHYRDKPSSTLACTFLFSAVNALIVLPHGILPMVLGHLVLDAAAFGLAPTLKRWVEEDQRKKDIPNQAVETEGGQL